MRAVRVKPLRRPSRPGRAGVRGSGRL